MKPEATVTLTLDKPRTLKFGPRALCRMGFLDHPFNLEDLQSKKRGYTALVSWIWACIERTPQEKITDAMSDPFARRLAEPEDVAEYIPPERVTEAANALIEAIRLSSPEPEAQPEPAAKPKKTAKAA